MKIHFDFNDWWIGYYREDEHHYICPLPTVVIRWNRKSKPYASSRVKGPLDELVKELYTKACADMLNSEIKALQRVIEVDNMNGTTIFPIRTKSNPPINLS